VIGLRVKLVIVIPDTQAFNDDDAVFPWVLIEKQQQQQQQQTNSWKTEQFWLL